MPGMYTHTVHPLHIVQEAIDNAVDEALAGFGKKHHRAASCKDGSVAGRGRGPRHPGRHAHGRKEARGRGRLHACCTPAASSRAPGDGVYHISGGLHGVGVAVSNALSKRCEVTVYRDDEKHTIAFEGGELKNKAEERKIEGQAYRHRGPVVARSEVLRFAEHSDERARAPGALEGLPAARPDDGARGRRQADKVWKYERGMAQYFEFMLDGRELVAPLFTGEKHLRRESHRGHHRRSSRARAPRGRSAGSPRATSSPTATST